MTKSRVPPGTTGMTESLVMEETGGTQETLEIGGSHGNPETLETPETPGIMAGILKTVVTRETRAPHGTPMTTGTERVVMPIKRMTSIKTTCAAMEDPMAERRALGLKQGMTPEVTPEMRAEVIGLAEVEAEVQNYLTKVFRNLKKFMCPLSLKIEYLHSYCLVRYLICKYCQIVHAFKAVFNSFVIKFKLLLKFIALLCSLFVKVA